MVFVKIRETYDIHTVQNKMTVIAIHTPKPGIIKRNYPGLLMQCRAYRPVAADVRLACASVLPLDPLGVGTSEGSVAPEDVFNPILYKAISNKGMSQLEARINQMNMSAGTMIGTSDLDGDTAMVDVDSLTSKTDEFPIYYGLLSETDNWKHASPQAGLSMSGLRPLVYEMVYNFGDTNHVNDSSIANGVTAPAADGIKETMYLRGILGKAKEFPYLNCTAYTAAAQGAGVSPPGFDTDWSGPDRGLPVNAELSVPWLNVVCGVIIVPPSRRHELFFRMVCEWQLEFTSIRPISEITQWDGLGRVGDVQHYQNYNYAEAKKAITGTEETILEDDSCMVSSNVPVEKVM